MKQQIFKFGVGVFLVVLCVSVVPMQHADAVYLNPLLLTTPSSSRVTIDTATTATRSITPVSPLKLKERILKNKPHISKLKKFKPAAFPKLKKAQFKKNSTPHFVQLPLLKGRMSTATTSKKTSTSSVSATYTKGFTKKSLISQSYKNIATAVFASYQKQINEKKLIIADLQTIVDTLDARGTPTPNLSDLLGKAGALVLSAETDLQTAQATFAILESATTIQQAQKLESDIKASLKTTTMQLDYTNDILTKTIAILQSLGVTYGEKKTIESEVISL